MLGLQNEREWQAFCEQGARAARRSPPTRASRRTPQRTAARDALRAIIVEAFAAAQRASR